VVTERYEQAFELWWRKLAAADLAATLPGVEEFARHAFEWGLLAATAHLDPSAFAELRERLTADRRDREFLAILSGLDLDDPLPGAEAA
jgi:hypothetical protein